MKRILIVSLTIVICLYVGVAVTNNLLAEKVLSDLVNIPLPTASILIKKNAIAGKLYGCGNGMQYTGVILLESDKSSEELANYYQRYHFHCIVESASGTSLTGFQYETINDIESRYYTVSLTLDHEYDDLGLSDAVWGILNLDFRGH